MSDATLDNLLVRVARLEARTGLGGVEARGGLVAKNSGNNLVLDASELLRRIETLEKLIALPKPPAVGTRQLVSVNGTIAWASIAEQGGETEPVLISLRVAMDQAIDDCFRVRMGNVAVINQLVGSSPLDVTLTQAEMAVLGAPTQRGTVVRVDLCDTAPNQYQFSSWVATAVYSDNTVRTFTGGRSTGVLSNVWPYYPYYLENGSFTL